ncbi:MAG: signal peptidase I [Clostridiales bacterium]|nr:signal peptidase I [Clostridiales bacterium]
MVKPLNEINREFETDWLIRAQNMQQTAPKKAHAVKTTRTTQRTATEKTHAIPKTTGKNTARKKTTAEKNKTRDLDKTSAPAASAAQQKKLKSKISDALFYAAIVIVMVIAAYYGTKSRGPIVILKHSVLTVLTSSMQSVIPKGSLVLVRVVPPDSLQTGDDITFMKDARTSITHRIIRIFENFEDSGDRGFETQGVDNHLPDSEIVYAGNVLGKVIFHIPKIGAILAFLCENLYLVFILFGLLVTVSFAIRGLFTPDAKHSKKALKKKKAKTTKKKKL